MSKIIIANFKANGSKKFFNNWLSDFNNKFQNQLKKHEKSGGDIFEKSLQICCISPSSAFIKKDVFDDYGFGDVSSPVACTAVDVGDLDVTLTKE